MPKKVVEIPRREERLCSWCENTYVILPGQSIDFCPECRNNLLAESNDFLVYMLSRVTGLNHIIMSAIPVAPEIMESLLLQERVTSRRLTMKGAAAKQKKQLTEFPAKE